MIRAQPMDSVVLMGGCDKTVPAQLMGAASADLPAVQLVAGPMMTSRYGEERLGACTDCRRFWGKYRAGEVSAEQINDIEGRLATTAGTCAVMGTASTMACIAETLGMSLPGTAAIPAVHADRLRAAEASGRAAARMIDQPITPQPDYYREIGRKCVADAAGSRRVNQCNHPFNGGCRSVGHQGVVGTYERAFGHHAGAGQPQAGRQTLHGGFLLCWWRWCRAARAAGPCCISIRRRSRARRSAIVLNVIPAMSIIA